MMAAILSQEEADLNSPDLSDSDRPPEIILRIGLNGILSVQIFADESSTQERLHEGLRAARLELEQLCQALSAYFSQGLYIR